MKKFGEKVEGYTIPVLNEREIRAAAGILFLFVFTAFMTIVYTSNFLMLKNFIVLFFIDFSIRIFIDPKYAPSLILGRIIVRKQTPEYVGAAQKKFAWVIGLVLAVTMLFLTVVLNSYSFITGIVCLICMVFLFFESVFGICLGCIFYRWFNKEKAQYCPGEVCERKDRQEIQKTSWVQVFILLFFVVIAVIIYVQFKDNFAQHPVELWGLFDKK